MLIRNIKEGDLNNLHNLQPEGWQNIVTYYEYYLKANHCISLCAVKNDKIVGIAAGILNMDTGWLAHIIVDKTLRRQGIGKEITLAIMDLLDRKGCKTQSLIASKDGELLYEKLGFITECEYVFFKGSLNLPYSLDGMVPISRSNYHRIAELDVVITGEKRCFFLDDFVFPGYLIEYDSKHKGYYLNGAGEGTILSNAYGIGMEFLKYKHFNSDQKSVIPNNNVQAVDFCRKNGLDEYDRAKRMFIGSRLYWHPEYVYSRIGGFYG